MGFQPVGVSTWLPVTLAGLVVILLVARIRAVPLVRAGHISQQDLNRVMFWSAAVVVGVSLAIALIQSLSAEPDVFCLSTFPPRHTAGMAYWFLQLLLDGGMVWWVWARDGDVLLARIAPIFTRGSVLRRRFSPATVRLVVTAMAVGGPLSAILVQQIRPGLHAGCSVL